MLFLNGLLLHADRTADTQIFGVLEVEIDMAEYDVDLETEITVNLDSNDFTVVYEQIEYDVELC